MPYVPNPIFYSLPQQYGNFVPQFYGMPPQQYGVHQQIKEGYTKCPPDFLLQPTSSTPPRQFLSSQDSASFQNQLQRQGKNQMKQNYGIPEKNWTTGKSVILKITQIVGGTLRSNY